MCKYALQEFRTMWKTVIQRKYSSYCNSISPSVRDATASVGLNHSSDEVSVIEMERRVQLIRLG